MDKYGRLSREDVVRAAATADVLEAQRQRLHDDQTTALLSKPLPKINDPLVRVAVLAGIGIKGKHYEPGDHAELPRSEARSQAALGRVKIL